MNWLWIPAVVLVSVFILALCWAFFKDYTCCPCRRTRPFTPPDDVEAPRSIASDGPPPTRPKPYRYYRPHAPPPQPPRHLPQIATEQVGIDPQYNFRGIVSASDAVHIKNGIPELDLHNLRVFEAKKVTQMFLQQSVSRYRCVRIVTGRGLHSIDGVPRIKPEVKMLLRGYNYKEVNKGGCLEVNL